MTRSPGLLRRRDDDAAGADAAASRFAQRRGWTSASAVLFVVLLLWRVSQLPRFGDFEIRTITAGTMALAFLAMAQAVVVISGGIDLSVGSMMVFANCLVGAVDGGPGPRRLPRCSPSPCSPSAVVLVDGHRPRDHGVRRARHHRHARRQLRPGRARPVRDRHAGRRHVTATSSASSPAGCRTGTRPCCGSSAPSCWCGCRCAAAGSGWRSSPSAATARRRSCPASRSPGRGCWRTRSAGSSPGSPGSSSRPRPAAASRGRRSAPTPR